LTASPTPSAQQQQHSAAQKPQHAAMHLPIMADMRSRDRRGAAGWGARAVGLCCAGLVVALARWCILV
jgi:hypothetical protein